MREIVITTESGDQINAIINQDGTLYDIESYHAEAYPALANMIERPTRIQDVIDAGFIVYYH